MGTDKILLNVKEGLARNYIEAMQIRFGGTATTHSYEIHTDDLQVFLYTYDLRPGMELVITQGQTVRPISIQRTPDKELDLIHINIFKKGQIEHAYIKNKQYTEATTSTGAFIHNGRFALQGEIPANLFYSSISITFTREAFLQFMPEATELYEGAFGHNQPMAYHMQLPIDVERLTDDILYYQDIEFGGRPMIIAKGLETLTSLILTAQKMSSQNNLNGLHADDYQRLMQIKNQLLSSFNQKINIQTIADTFGISTSKLKRDFKTLFDCSIYQFYAHAKMDEAYRRLKTGDYSVMEVGYDLGYSNLSKFASMFKKVKGISPSEVNR
ncbi:helix-turn-helix transcriptional regulator [Carboxylicivirga sediminis]|uniref:Helix-turn-helix transcriptional regulator n=1 Tax=Carboxylicivirga sediminis TaxID=2006564 RepID=A0A941F240_9BACT|nr:AraC family transcriptional regulator [Carboxylicivirga sediminis]MBR8533960.1 helix-turn-helix transcriptional regulator [Carboxylicivirga sediminis]